jgi:hypothetical protein
MGRKYVVSEEVIIGGSQPIRQWRLLQIADAVHAQRYPVAAARHMLGSVGVRGVGVIQQRRREERRHVDGGKDQKQQRPGSRWSKAKGILGRRLEGKSEVIRHGC